MNYGDKFIKHKAEQNEDSHLNGSSKFQNSHVVELNKSDSGKNALYFSGNEMIAENKTTHQLFEEQVSRMPNRVALITDKLELTYAELNEKANQLAYFLIENYSIQPDEPVGLIAERSERMIVTMIAILKAGGAYVPIEPTNPFERTQFMIEDSKMKVLLTESPILNKIQSAYSELQLVDIWDENNFLDKTENPTTKTTAKNLVYIIYTSGSTGTPKGVMIEHGNLVHYIGAYLERIKLTPDDIYLQVSPASFDTFAEELYPAILTGAKVVITKKSQVWDIQQLTNLINHYKASFISCTPALLSAINEVFVPERKLTFLVGGDVLKCEHINNLVRKSSIYNGYGPTETTICATFYHVKEIEENPIPIGKALQGYQVYILNNSNENASVGEPGELCIAGRGLARGYLGKNELTKEKFIDNPVNQGERIYRTGDLCRFQPDGNIEFIGRVDNQVKIRGFRIELGEIEKTIIQYPEIKDCVVTVIENEENKELAAYVIPNKLLLDSQSGFSFDVDGLITFLKLKLMDYMVPVYFVEMDRFPVTTNDKIDRKNLPLPQKHLYRLKKQHVSPITENEKAIAEIWEEVLSIKNIGLDENFFYIGGHSLLATKIINRVNKVFGTQLMVSVLFEAPTVREFAVKVHNNETLKEAGALIQLRPGNGNPIFLFSGIDGNPFTFTKLANYFQPGSPLYFIQYPAGGITEIKYNNLEDFSKEIISKIKSIQKTGPYSLIGYSLGGRIAFETALQLQLSGEKIKFLSILSALPPLFTNNTNPFVNFLLIESDVFYKINYKLKINYLRHRVGHLFERFFRKLSTTTPKGKFENVHFFVDVDEEIEKYLGMYNLWRKHSIKTKFNGNMMLIRENNIDEDWKYTAYYYGQVYPDYNWSKFVDGNVTIETVPFGHTVLLEEPNVQGIAKILNNYIIQTEENN